MVAVVSLAGCADRSPDTPTESPAATSPGNAREALQLKPELNVVGYWSFDAQNDPGVDSSGKSAKAQLSRATWSDGGRSGGALYFNGSDSVVTIADGAWNAGNPVTYNLWYKSEGSAKGHLLEHAFATKAAGAFSVDAGTAKFTAYYDGTRKSRDASFGTPVSNNWTMLTIVLDDGSVRLFRNGVSVFESSRTLPKLAGAMRIGAAGANQNPFAGWIDEVAVFKRALSAGQVSELHAMYAPATPPGGESGLLAHWSFDDGTANDVSGRQSHGEVSGATSDDQGRFGKAMRFDGKSYIRIPDGSWNKAAPVTYNAWIKPEGEPYGFVFDHHIGWQDGGSFALMNELKKQLKFLAFDDAGNEVEVIGDGVPSDTWTMLTVVFTGTEVRLYRNGSLWETLAKKGLPQVEGDLYLGASENAKWGFFTGWMDEVSVHGHALSEAEIIGLRDGNASNLSAEELDILKKYPIDQLHQVTAEASEAYAAASAAARPAAAKRYRMLLNLWPKVSPPPVQHVSERILQREREYLQALPAEQEKLKSLPEHERRIRLDAFKENFFRDVIAR